MPIDVKWGNDEKTLAVIHLTDPWTINELADAVDRVGFLMDEVEHRVSPVVDMTDAPRVPPGVLAGFPRVASRMGHPNSTGKLYIVGAHRHFRAFLDIFSNVFRKMEYRETIADIEPLDAQEEPESSGG